jgi:hypothetical protein
VGAPAERTGRTQEQEQTQEQTRPGAGASPARSLLNGYGLLQFTPNPKKSARSPELVKEKNTRQFRHTRQYKKKQVGIFLHKKHINNKKINHI